MQLFRRMNRALALTDAAQACLAAAAPELRCAVRKPSISCARRRQRPADRQPDAIVRGQVAGAAARPLLGAAPEHRDAHRRQQPPARPARRRSAQHDRSGRISGARTWTSRSASAAATTRISTSPKLFSVFDAALQPGAAEAQPAERAGRSHPARCCTTRPSTAPNTRRSANRCGACGCAAGVADRVDARAAPHFSSASLTIEAVLDGQASRSACRCWRWPTSRPGGWSPRSAGRCRSSSRTGSSAADDRAAPGIAFRK